MIPLYRHMAQVVRQEPVDTCFALLGDANMAFAGALADLGMRMIYVRHEHCAVVAAMAHSRKTGGPSLATVTCGPGLTQLMTALPAAVRARLPVVIIAGEAPLGAAWYNQAIDQAPFVVATGAAYVPLHSSGRLGPGLRDAFLQAQMDRRPVVVGVPFDLQGESCADDTPLPVPASRLVPRVSPLAPGSEDVANAVEVISGSNRILILAGLGAVEAEAGPACAALADCLGAPLATTLPARGLFHDHPFYLGVAGGFASDQTREVCAEADLIIAVGASLASHGSDKGQLWKDAAVLQIDREPTSLSQGLIVAQHHLWADAKLGVQSLISALPKRSTTWRTAKMASDIETRPADGSPRMKGPGHDPRDFVAALDKALPTDWEMVNSSGHCSFFFAHMRRRPQAKFLTIREFGAIGNGISFAMGVAAARPDCPVVLFDGDGSVLMHVQEIETMLRHQMPVLIVIMNDGGFGSEFHKLRAEGQNTDGAVFGRTDLAAIARGFGAVGHTIENLDDLPALVSAFSEENQVTIWDVPVNDRVASPVIQRAHPSRY